MRDRRILEKFLGSRRLGTLAVGKLGDLPIGTDPRNAEMIIAILAGVVVNLECEDDDKESDYKKALRGAGLLTTPLITSPLPKSHYQPHQHPNKLLLYFGLVL